MYMRSGQLLYNPKENVVVRVMVGWNRDKDNVIVRRCDNNQIVYMPRADMQEVINPIKFTTRGRDTGELYEASIN